MGTVFSAGTFLAASKEWSNNIISTCRHQQSAGGRGGAHQEHITKVGVNNDFEERGALFFILDKFLTDVDN